MADSLRDQLLKSGIVKQVHDEKAAQAPVRGARPPGGNRGGAGDKGKPGETKRRPPQQQQQQQRQQQRQQQPRKPAAASGEMDLARAYAIRAQTEAGERRQLEQAAAEEARQRKERKRLLQEALDGKALNKPDVDQVRHFPYGDKIRRVHVDAGQLVALNKGELGVVQHGGRYLLVDRATLDAVQAIAPEQVALLVDPNAVSESDDGVPDDVMW
jgi:uncharacterized protein YaiL (DUF2058 family)